MGGDETPGLTDFQNSGWIGEDSDPLYRSYEPGFDGQVPKSSSGGSSALWEEFPTLGNQPQQVQKKQIMIEFDFFFLNTFLFPLVFFFRQRLIEIEEKRGIRSKTQEGPIRREN